MLKCPYCSSTDIEMLLEIPNMPNFLSAVDPHKLKYLKLFNYSLSYCKSCELGFNSSPLPDEELTFLYENYEYILPSKGIGHTKYYRFIELVKTFCAPTDKIVEIGSSDCFVLKNLKSSSFKDLLAVEPSPLGDLCDEINVIKSFYRDDLFEDGAVDVFLMRHVFEHFKDPFRLLENLKSKLSPNGKIIIEVPNFSAFHHQHLFYYNINFLNRLSKDMGLYINFAEVDEESNAIRVVFSKNYRNNFIINEDKEKKYLNSVSSWNTLKDKLTKLFSELDDIVIWGAGSSTVVNLSLLDKKMLNDKNITVVDGDDNKVGKVVPIIDKTVKPVSFLKGKTIQNLLIMSSFYKEIIERIEREGIKVQNVEIIF